MKPKWQKLASLAQEICTLWFQFFGAVFASKGYPFKNIFDIKRQSPIILFVCAPVPLPHCIMGRTVIVAFSGTTRSLLFVNIE